MQMKVIYFHIFTQTIVNFGKYFTSSEACISTPLFILFIFFSLLLQIILHRAKKEKEKQTLDLGVKDLNLSPGYSME